MYYKCIIVLRGAENYMFKIHHAEENITKTFRFPKSLIEKMSEIAQKESISLNNFIIQCCEYSISQLIESEENA